jgi:anti-anti-sigma factor
VSLLKVILVAGAADPVIMLAGEADQASHALLAEVLDAQLSGQAAHLTIDVSGLRCADSSFVTALAAAAVVLKHRGGNLTLMHPQQSVLRMLTAILIILEEIAAAAGPSSDDRLRACLRCSRRADHHLASVQVAGAGTPIEAWWSWCGRR